MLEPAAAHGNPHPARSDQWIAGGRSILVAAGCLLAAVVLAACGAPAATATATPVPSATKRPPTATSSPTPAPRHPSAVITVWLSWGPDEMLAFDRVIEAYRQLNPSVEFEISYHRPDALLADFETAVDAGGPLPSMLIGPASWGDDLFGAGALRDVGGSLLAEQRAGVHPYAWSQVARGNVLLGLPLELKGTVLYRNARLAAEPAQSIADMVDRALEARLTGAVGASLDLGFRQAAPMIRACKGELRTEPDIDPVGRPVGLCWLRLLSQLGRTGPVVFDTDEDLASFEDGQSAWLLESTDRILELEGAIGESSLEIDPWPLYQPTGERLAGYVWTENAYFPAGSGDRDFEATWSFAVNLLAPQNQRLFADARGVRHIPVLETVTVDEPLLARAREVVLSGVPLPDQRGIDDIVDGLSTAVRLTVGQGGDPELALDLALQKIREARIPTPTPTSTPAPTITPTPSDTPPPTPPPG